MPRGDSAVTRRTLIGAAAATGAGAATPAAFAGGASPRRARKVDVVIVGAGLSGLVAARKLKRAGRSFVVLEASDRTGGRILNLPTGPGRNQVTEAGGEWVATRQHSILELCDELGVSRFKTYNEGETTYFDGSAHRYSGPFPPVSPAAKASLADALGELTAMAAEVPIEAPHEAPRAVEWDGQTVASWLAANVSEPEARALLEVAAGGPVGGTAQGMSLLHYLFIAAANGSPLELVTVDGGALEFRLNGGSGLLVKRVAKKVGAVNIMLGSPVHRITQRRGGVLVESAAGAFRAASVIVATAPATAALIDYDPPLGAARAQFFQRGAMGWLIKCFAVYPEPFWRSQGLNGMATSTVPPLDGIFDNSPANGSVGCLYGLIAGYNARIWSQRSLANRRKAVLGVFTACFGPQAASPTRYLEHDWAQEPYIRGGAAMALPPSVLTQFPSVLRSPVGHIHWASTETATYSYGDMDGAILAGERAADEVLA